MENDFIKPSMTDLEGKAGKDVLTYLKKAKVKSDNNVKQKSSEYKKAILVERKKKY